METRTHPQTAGVTTQNQQQQLTASDVRVASLAALLGATTAATTTRHHNDKHLAVITLEEVAEHCDINDCWLVVDDLVYDVTGFLVHHPAGIEILLEHAGRDVSAVFHGVGHSAHARSLLHRMLIGKLPQWQCLSAQRT